MNEIAMKYVGPSSMNFKHVGLEEFFCRKNMGTVYKLL
jgi:hypothetical protein